MTMLGHKVTAEELLAMPHDQPCELIAGEMIMMTPAGGEHCGIASRINVLLGFHVMKNKLGSTYVSDPGFQIASNPDTVRAPDVAFLRRGGLSETPKFFQGAPDLAVEVISPTDRQQEVDEKTQAWLDAGTRMVWVVSPDFRSVAVHRPGQPVRILHEHDTITGEDVVPGFECRVGEFFGE